jgi:hypothetical protein
MSGAVIEKTTGCSHTEYRITGPLEAVFKEITSLFVNYHPFGYGTHVHALSMKGEDQFVARVSRLNSCD